MLKKTEGAYAEKHGNRRRFVRKMLRNVCIYAKVFEFKISV